jgi:hypothetical protein
MLLGVGLAVCVATAAVAQDKTGPDGKPVRTIPITPGGKPAPVPASPPLDEPAAAKPIAKAPSPPPVMSEERCADEEMDFDAAKGACRERAPSMDPSAPMEAEEEPAEPPSAGPDLSYPAPAALPPWSVPVVPSKLPPPGYPAACPWPLPKGLRCTPDGAIPITGTRRARAAPR